MFLNDYLVNYRASEATSSSRYDGILFDKNHFHFLPSRVKHKQRAFFAALFMVVLTFLRGAYSIPLFFAQK